MWVRRGLIVLVIGDLLATCLVGGGRCETMSEALTSAYQGNPDLGQQRAATRAVDEDVAKAKSGYRPKVTGAADLGYQITNAQNAQQLDTRTGPSVPRAADLQIRQTVFDGNRTTSGVAKSESQVLRSREQLRDKEQQTLQSGATAYMDVLRDVAVVGLRKNNVEVLIVRLREARARYKVKEVTYTDVAQVASSLATARSGYFIAQGNLAKSMATYRRVIGRAPQRLEAARPIDSLLPVDLPAAVRTAFAEHPLIQAALQNVDVASLDVRLAESRLYPTVDAIGRVRQSAAENGNPSRDYFQGGARAELNVPIYTGGADYAAIREAKERLSRTRLQAETARDMVREQLVSAWATLAASKAKIQSAQTAVKASEAAYIDVREEAKMGQRTTLNVLMALQTLLEARVSLVEAQRDRVVASYVAMGALGGLSATALGLATPRYDPTIHYMQVKDKWIGLRTPDGR